jgi:hypothetical protein
MLLKVSLLFLVGMVAIALIGRALFPAAMRRHIQRRKPGLCPRCGRHMIGSSPCACTTNAGGRR